jgi:nucleotide-binding universal stress UspA family protein
LNNRGETLKNSILDYLVGLSMCPEDVQITILHVFRKASASEELMGKKFTKEEKDRFANLLQNAKDHLIEKGFVPENIRTVMVEDPYVTIADGIIDQFKKEKFDMVVIGRKRMSKAEEFVMGDISIKLVRALENAAVLVVTSP